MNPNNVNHFATAAVGVNRARSKFPRSSKVITDMNAGYLYPLYVDEILPGDNMKIKASAVIRALSPTVFPTMDNAYLDVYAFFVPNRIVWDKWKEFMGELPQNAYWAPSSLPSMPKITYTPAQRHNDDVLSYLGVPAQYGSSSSSHYTVSALPVRGFTKIFNDWFYDQNIQQQLYLDTSSTSVSYAYSDPFADCYKGGKLPRVNKFKDYFTSALPSPQRGSNVTLPINFGSRYAPVGTRSVFVPLEDTITPLWFQGANGTSISSSTSWRSFGTKSTTPSGFSERVYPFAVDESTGGSEPSPNVKVAPVNLWADMNSFINDLNITVNQMRISFQTQKYLETLARGGCRYVEQLFAQYGVTSSDQTQQRSQYLGGKRFPINIYQVEQTSPSAREGWTTDEDVGKIFGYSLTSFADENLVDSFFEEHGFLFIVGCIRSDNSYGQGIEKFWRRYDRLDFYTPVFANLGEMPVHNYEIYANTSDDDSVFGYQEAWVEYRTKPNKLIGNCQIRNDSNASLSLGRTYAQRFTSVPTLSGLVPFDSNAVGQTLQASSNQFIVDLFVDNESVRVMPMYSVPGLIDHA